MSVVKSIELVVPKEVYLAGSDIDGQLVLTLHSTLVDPLVKVELIGRGYLEWIEETNVEKDYSQPGTCVNKADYVHKTKTFKIERNWLGPGVHTFDFHFVLPPRIPSTFTSRVGRICYFLQALCATRELILGKLKKYIMVQGTSVFSQDTVESEYPLVVEVRKALLYNCCFHSSPITVRLSLDKSIYAPGDDIGFTMEITNETGKSIKKVVFALHSVVLYKAFNLRAERRTLEQREEMVRLESHVANNPCEVTKIHSIISLPKVMPVSSCCKSDDIMDIGYELTATVHFPWCMSTVAAKIPIIIRNVAEPKG
ncbi:arrestin domain-containing protein 5 [Sceloporus undulatus]|uniref:arrestin domain-containing protein 5 n=1 Tax=Sceloporus undulatus TaxID=8520 RepID=UPI001C4DA511|nr:arrestin domain-containing protein 5 [Sceloporus undulatus]